MTEVIDTNHNVNAKIPQLKAAGIRTVIRYISTNTQNEKCIKRSEAENIINAGLKLGYVFEVWGGADNFSHSDINASSGERHGNFAASWAASLGAPSSAAIYFAIDTDASLAQIRSFVIPYFRAVKSAVAGRFRLGGYGCGAVLEELERERLVTYFWLSNAMGWNGSRQYRDSKKWNLLQHLPKNIAGLDTDPNDINPLHPDIGDYGKAPPTLPPIVEWKRVPPVDPAPTWFQKLLELFRK